MGARCAGAHLQSQHATLATGRGQGDLCKFKTILGHGPHSERLLSYSKLENKSLF